MTAATYAVCCVCLSWGILSFAESSRTTVTGWITDTLCAAKGANAQHVECAKRSVASGKAKYALYDERTKRLYILEPQETVALYLALGQRVKVTGTLNFSPQQRTEVLSISAIEPAPSATRSR